MRTTGNLDAVRVTGRESRDGYARRWHLYAFAICAHPWIRTFDIQTFADTKVHAHGSILDGTYASDRCPNGYRTHGIGGGGGVNDSGFSWLRGIVPHVDLKGVSVQMTGPLSPSIGGMVASQTCAKF